HQNHDQQYKNTPHCSHFFLLCKFVKIVSNSSFNADPFVSSPKLLGVIISHLHFSHCVQRWFHLRRVSSSRSCCVADRKPPAVGDEPQGDSDSLTGYYSAGVNPYFEVTHRFPLDLGPPMCADNTFCVKLIAQTRVSLRAIPNLQGTIVSQAVRP